LKPLSPALIGARIEHILGAVGVAFEPAAVALIARAARGSLRDGLSLLDQGIAFGGGEVREEVVRTMLGVVDRDYVYRIAQALADGDGPLLMREGDALAARGLAFASALEELASLFHRIAVVQAVPAAAGQFDDDGQVGAIADRFAPEYVQLVYQIAAQGRIDLTLAPDEATGFTMTLLRMLAFAPVAQAGGDAPRGERAVAASASSRQTAPLPRPASGPTLEPAAAGAASAPTLGVMKPAAVPAAHAADPALPRARVALPEDPAAWPAFIAGLKLSGMAAQLAAQTELKAITGNALTLALPVAHKHLADRMYADKLKNALEQATGRKLLLALEVGAPAEGSLAANEKRERAEARAKGEAAFRDEPFVRDLIARFDGQVKPDSIVPIARDPDSQ
jgi:DNA polymerase-3 subunit gamma/tau